MRYMRGVSHLNKFSIFPRHFLCNFRRPESSTTQLLRKMEVFTDLPRESALQNLYQKTQASLMFSLLAKMPSGRHPLNALKDQYFDRTRESELGLRMYVLILLAKCIDPRFTNPSIYLKQVQLAQLVELLHIAFEIQNCILELEAADNDDDRKVIEDANRLAVIAGDFFMASASTQLAELENQCIVDQVSKSIADISTGRLLFHDKMDTVTDWLTAVNLNSTSLVKRSAWSVLRLNDKSRAMMPPTDVKHDFLSVDQNAKLEVDLLENDLAISGSIFATYLFLAHKLKDDYNLYKQGSDQSYLLPFCINREYPNADMATRISDLSCHCISTSQAALSAFPDTTAKLMLADLLSLQEL